MKGHARMTKTVATVIVLVLSLLQQGICEIKMISVDVPQNPARNTNVTLTCNYKTDAQGPYLIKWLHNGLEFFKFRPKEQEKELFDSKLTVNVEESTGSKVVLQEIDLTASGNYTCEVVGDSPRFMMHSMSSEMNVVVIPDDQPSIEGDVLDHYAVGNKVNLTCIAPPSLPAASLAWLINEKKAPKDYIHEYAPERFSDGLFVSRLRLNFELSQSHFINGELKLKCTATIAPHYHESNEHSQQDPSVKTKEVRNLPEEYSLFATVNSGCSSMWRNLRPHILVQLLLLLLTFSHVLR